MNKSLPKLLPHHTNSIDSSSNNSAVNLSVFINSIACPIDKFVTKIHALLRPHVEVAHQADLFVILNHIIETSRTIQNILKHYTLAIHALTLSYWHINDVLKNSLIVKLLLF